MSQPEYHQEEPTGQITGVRVALVRDNEDPENLGRVKLQYPWRDADDESPWARIATNMTGDDYGSYFLPEVGEEVLVAFENGDIHNPVVMGSLWSGNRKPPEDNSDGENDIRTIKTRSGHQIEFDDGDEGAITVETAGGHELRFDDDSDSVTVTDTSGNSIEMDAGSDEISLSASDTIRLDANKIQLSAKQEVDIDSKGKVNISGAQQTDLTSKGPLNVESSALLEVSSSGIVTVSGSLIQLN